MQEGGESWFRNALTDPRGDWDVGYIGLFVLMVLVIGAIPFVCGMAVYCAMNRCETYSPMGVGSAIAYICGGFATALGGLGFYRWGDERGRPPSVPPDPYGSDPYRDDPRQGSIL